MPGEKHGLHGWLSSAREVLQTLKTQLDGRFDADAVLESSGGKRHARQLSTGSWALMPAVELGEGEVCEVFVGEKPVAIARKDGLIYAIDGSCPHEGGPLGQGKLREHAVLCPFHGWRFDLRSGACLNKPAFAVHTLDVFERDGQICLRDPSHR